MNPFVMFYEDEFTRALQEIGVSDDDIEKIISIGNSTDSDRVCMIDLGVDIAPNSDVVRLERVSGRHTLSYSSGGFSSTTDITAKIPPRNGFLSREEWLKKLSDLRK